MLVDLKGTTLKQITHKATFAVFRELFMAELPSRYPELVHKIMLVNTPIFFETVFQSEISPQLSEDARGKIVISGSADCKELNLIKQPKVYGGDSDFSITIEAGPWCAETPAYEESKGFEMVEHEDDQEDLLGNDNFDMGDLRAQLSGKSALLTPQPCLASTSQRCKTPLVAAICRL